MTNLLRGLKVVDALGAFYRDGGRLMVADEFDGTRDVDEVLRGFEGHEVRLLAHHRPPEPPLRERWGAGCCLLENTGRCHYGHHDDPRLLFTFDSVGILRRVGEDWAVEKMGGERLRVHIGFLVGHRSQVVATSIPNLEDIDEKIRSFDPSDLDPTSLEDLTGRLGEIRDFVQQIENLKREL
jgi:hypothetical protein